MEEMMNYVRAALKFQVTATASRKTMTVEDILDEIDRVFDEKIAECSTIIAEVTEAEDK